MTWTEMDGPPAETSTHRGFRRKVIERIAAEAVQGSGLSVRSRWHALDHVAGVPMKNAGNPSEVANAILYLASGKASFITSHVLSVEGGKSCS